MFNAVDGFPTMSPIVTFTGPIVGPGITVLHNDHTSGLSEAQLKCCGLVQLSTFITPGTPSKPPFRGSHQFHVFVIFPIYVNPWAVRCKKMADRQTTQFQPGTMFSCTGRVVALLNHQLMIQPPQLPQDLVLMVAPDTWSFFERPSRDFASTFTQVASAKSSSSDPRSKFMTPVKRKAAQHFGPSNLSTPSPMDGTGIFSSPRTYGPFRIRCNSTVLTQTPKPRRQTLRTLRLTNVHGQAILCNAPPT
jgi:hypothetical protein